MTATERQNQAMRKMAKIWLKLLEEEYRDKKIWDAIYQIAKHSGASNLNEDSLFSAGLMWYQSYDLSAIFGLESYKVDNFIHFFVEAIAEEFEASVDDVTQIYETSNSGKNPQTSLFFKFYKLFEPNFDTKVKVSKPAIIGFENISKLIIDNSVLKAYLEERKNKKADLFTLR